MRPSEAAMTQLEKAYREFDEQRLARIRATELIQIERLRQFKLKAAGRFQHTPSDDQLIDWQRFGMLQEEMGEVSRNLLARDGLVTDGDKEDEKLLKELSQIAALSLAWMERLV